MLHRCRVKIIRTHLRVTEFMQHRIFLIEKKKTQNEDDSTFSNMVHSASSGNTALLLLPESNCCRRFTEWFFRSKSFFKNFFYLSSTKLLSDSMQAQQHRKHLVFCTSRIGELGNKGQGLSWEYLPASRTQ